jgi:hypothetical protein
MQVRAAFLVILLAGLVAGCGSGTEEPACQPPLVRCNDGQCHECCSDEHCAEGEVCALGGCIPGPVGTSCEGDRDPCWEPMYCDPDLDICQPRCTQDADCVAVALPHGDSRVCSADGQCGFQPCQANGDCRPGTVCFEEKCVAFETCPLQATCGVLPAELVLRPGETARVLVQATLASGAQAPGLTFTWSSDAESVATVVAGGVSAGAEAGRAQLTASVPDCALACQAEVVNLGPAPADALRVGVRDGRDRGPLAGASVEVEGFAAVETDQDGVALFPGLDLAGSPARVRVTAAGLTPLDLLAAGANDLALTLEPSLLEGTGGFRAPVSFDDIHCAAGEPCEVKVALAGLSLPWNPFARPPERIFGERLKMHVVLGGTQMDLGLPGGTVLGLNATWFHELAEPTGPTGQRLPWALGKRVNLSTIIEVFGYCISSGDVPGTGSMLATLFGSLLAGGSSSLAPGTEFSPLRWAADPLDRDGDGRWDDLVPRYDDLQGLPGGGLRLAVPASRSVLVQVPAMPALPEGSFAYDGVILIALVSVPGAGLVPVGFGAGADCDLTGPGPCDGLIEAVELRVADLAGRLPQAAVERLVVAIALGGGPFSQEGVGEPWRVAGQVFRLPAFEGELTLRPFSPPLSVSLDALAGSVQISGLSVETDTLALLVHAPEESLWQLLSPPLEGALALPAPPPGLENMDGVVLVGLELAGGKTYQELLAGQGASLGELVLGLDGFTLAWSEGASPDCGCGAGAAGGERWLLLGAVAILAWLLSRRGESARPPAG